MQVFLIKKLVNECFHYAESEQIIRLPRREYVNNRRPIETGLSQFVGQFIPSLDYAKRLGESLARDISKIASFNTLQYTTNTSGRFLGQVKYAPDNSDSG